MPADFYDLLDVGPDASPEAIRRAYREKARQYHPDVNPDARSSDQFKAIRTAYEVLSDASKRKDYDRMGHRAYVDARLDGLPGANGSGSSARSSGQSSGGSRSKGANRETRRSKAARSSTTAARSSGRARSTVQGTGGSSKNRSSWGERTISEPGARGRAMRAGDRIGVGPVLALAAAGYLAGLATLLFSNSAALGPVTDALSAGDFDAFIAIVQTPGFAEPLSFVSSSIDSPSPALLFLFGAVVFPVVLAVHAIRTNRAAWWVSVVFALGPQISLGLAAGGVVTTVGVDLALYVLLPALAVLATAATWFRN